jgi:exopolyphosphatase/guanosine-5'-triphosphate,3'-diphosphate pyrophosphatase
MSGGTAKGALMTAISARWEWRTFGPGARVAERCWRDIEPTAEQVSDEVYLLSDSGQTVKYRDQLMDVKQLLETDAFGLQQWTPVMKASFPIGRTELHQVFSALNVPVPPLAREHYTFDEFRAELTGPGRGIRAVDVHKRRVRYRPDGCSAEVTEVRADGIPGSTVAVEGEDAAAVIGVVRSLGLEDYLNTAYPPGLARMLDAVPDRYAVIDAGTNSIKFHIAERTADGGWRTLVDRAELTRLGEGLTEGGPIGREPLERTVAAVSGMAEEARAQRVLAIAAVGTAGLRMASNGREVVSEIARRTGVEIDVIPGDEESRIAFLAVRSGLPTPRGSAAVLDTGGGSTQLTFGHDDAVDEQWSVNVGAVRYTEQFGLDDAVSEDALGDAGAAISRDLGRLDGRPPVDDLVGMGGAITNLTAVSLALDPYDPDRVQGAVLERSEIDRQIELYRTTRTEDRRSIVGLQPKRAEVILAGACIVRTVMDKLGADRLTVSDRGLRHGVLAERFGSDDEATK